MEELRARVINNIKSIQSKITESLETIEGRSFDHDAWERKDRNGKGQVNIIQEGTVFEKGGINYTEIEIPLSKTLATYMSERGKNIDKDRLDDYLLFATGVSLVIHPRNPMVPTIHANYRYLELTLDGKIKDWWFAGGTDLTPYYLDEDDCKSFHTSIKKACDYLSPNFYFKYKAECDDYFMIKHRGFRRGVGGIFFDDINQWSPEVLIEFQSKCGDAFVEFYSDVVRKHLNDEYGKKQRHWQKIRRGHYVEFNIGYDRGTKFGLITPDANLEAVFMPLPLNARWEYKHTVEEGSEEHKILEVLRNPREWVN
jgi:coproporphyrinogen III oxidase